ncbi:hypothetical protein [Paenibacillus thalictri]|uniref:Uncharacterized protein n=1 Tax=Paenibacillus thalictri TaxID=2527873 RepID=A0A4Q9DHZ6_9BACL|nr:hypothetical protein [Paenibacillus thalictri]TBL71178.1 hypothetical protein EYB31_30835 [Paenibacillus thalictri]
MNEPSGSAAERFAVYRKTARPYAPLLTIWGLEWIASAALSFLGQWRDMETYHMYTLAAAAILTLIAAVWSKRSLLRRANAGSLLLPALCVLMAVGALFVLDYVQAIDPFFVPLLHAFALAVGYTFVSIYLGRPLLYLGLWLFALDVVVALHYLGYTLLILSGFGGLSLLVFAWLIGEWNRKRRRKPDKRNKSRKTRPLVVELE